MHSSIVECKKVDVIAKHRKENQVVYICKRNVTITQIILISIDKKGLAQSSSSQSLLAKSFFSKQMIIALLTCSKLVDW